MLRLLQLSFEWATSYLLAPYYETSHSLYLQKQQSYLKEWLKLSPHLEYSIHLATALSNEINQSSMIAVRASNPKISSINRAVLVFEAMQKNVSYQERIELYDLQDKTCVHELVHIPPQDTWAKASGVQLAYERYQIHLVNLVSDDVKLVTTWSSPIFEVGHSFAEKNFRYRWGKIWNIDFLDAAKLDLKLSLLSVFLQPVDLQNKPKKLWGRFKLQIRKTLSQVSENPIIINFLFFWALSFRLAYISPQGEMKARYSWLSVTSWQAWLRPTSL